MQEDRCSNLCEISHGINSVDIDGYIHELSMIEGSVCNSRKHKFVEQLPEMPFFGEKSRRLLNGNDFSINVYLNRFLAGFQRSSVNLINTLNSDLASVLDSSVEENVVLLTFVGYADFQEDLTETKSFQIECFLMDQVLKIACEESINLKMIYAPHPASDYRRIKQHCFFKNRHIDIHKETMRTYFFSDIAIALLSATSYEAMFFGVTSFTPLINLDNLHAPEYLNLIHYPDSDGSEELLASLKEVLNKVKPISMLERGDIVEQRVQRIDNLNDLSNEEEPLDPLDSEMSKALDNAIS